MDQLPEAIYQAPGDYDLEHIGDTRDIEFFVELAKRLRPTRVLELACGNGRVTLPLGEAGVAHGFCVTGLEIVPQMLEAANARREAAPPDVRANLTLHEGDMRDWRADKPFDLIVTPCSSLCHLLTLADQLRAFRCAFANLAPGGRFVVDIAMAEMGVYTDSFSSSPREIMEIDLDTFDEATTTRMIRYKTTRYLPHQQRAHIRFLYDKFVGDSMKMSTERTISDFESHVYYPRELQLLFLHAGFRVESMVGDYSGHPMSRRSRQMIVTGVRPD